MAASITSLDAEFERPPSRRELHFSQQRSSLRSGYSGHTSQSQTSRPHSAPRRDDFDFDLDPPADRADSETLPPTSSPAPYVPYTRARRGSTSRAKGCGCVSGGHRLSKSTPDDAQRLDGLAAPDSWQKPHELLMSSDSPLLDISPATESVIASASQRQSVKGLGLSVLARADTPNSQLEVEQLEITALPTMTPPPNEKAGPHPRRSRLLTELYTVSYLIFFAILGTLARLGLQALTFYPGAPVIFSELWANVGGTFVMGFLAEDQRLFHNEWGARSDEETPVPSPSAANNDAKKKHASVKKTIPLYIGLATGFCGSFTSFSSFSRDVFLALSNDLRTPSSPPLPRPVPDSAMSTLAVLLTTLSLSYCALKSGSHLALLLDPITPTLPFRLTRRFLDPLVLILSCAAWAGAIACTLIAPSAHDAWRGQVLFALVFAPPGCLLRYYISLLLNPLRPRFPLGTFASNVLGTAVLGAAFNMQRVQLFSTGVAGGSRIGCQALQGVQDGFCGCLTTVSTWVLEMDTLKKRHAYVYGVASVGVGVGVLVGVMGGVRWSVGWEGVVCAV